MRSEWKFTFSTEVVLAAADAKVRYHQGRLMHWEAELEQAENDLRANGFDIRSAVNLTPSTSNSYREQPVLDQTKVQRVRECDTKAAEHRGMVAEFGTWVRALQANPGPISLQLTISDMQFFGL